MLPRWVMRLLRREEIDLIEYTPVPRFDFLDVAEQYWQAYKHLPTPANIPIYWPHYLLMGHAVEMALKAYLLSRVVTLAKLRSKGHRLDKLRRMATAHGLSLDEDTIRSIDKHLGPMHSKLLARYPNYRGGMRNGVVFASESEAAVERLMTAVRRAVHPVIVTRHP